nr:unnamed protein product [Callosobruchus analis]CAI5859045.1 unnamed protein product [Callosobruchus analis]
MVEERTKHLIIVDNVRLKYSTYCSYGSKRSAMSFIAWIAPENSRSTSMASSVWKSIKCRSCVTCTTTSYCILT